MARALGNLSQFRDALKKRPMQRSERWEVSITLPTSLDVDRTSAERDVVLFCEEVQVPGMVVENKEIN